MTPNRSRQPTPGSHLGVCDAHRPAWLRSVVGLKTNEQVHRDDPHRCTVKTTDLIEQDQPPGPISLVSFVVPAWNEEGHLAATLTCIREAARLLGEPFEIVVADDGSTDRTGEIAEQLADRTVHVNHRQIAAARNAGAQAAQGDLLIFVDADTTVTSRLLRAVVDAVRQGAIGGGCLARFDGPVPIWGWLAVVLANAFNRLLRVAYGCFLFCTREAFEAAGGFDTSLYITEEVAMSQALRRVGRFVLLPERVVTSGRKTRMIGIRQALPIAFRAVFYGFHSRQGKELWYEERYKSSAKKPL